jgi:hypothetical protein
MGLPLIAGFVCAYLRLEHIYGAVPLFVVGVALLVAALFRFGQRCASGSLRPSTIAELADRTQLISTILRTGLDAAQRCAPTDPLTAASAM